MTQAANNSGATNAAVTGVSGVDALERFTNAADWLHSLGDVPPERIVMKPRPGTATEQDLLRMVDREKRLVELVDGTLVEKPVGLIESRIAMVLAIALGNFIMPRRLGLLAGEGGTLRMRAGQIRIPDISFIAAADIPPGTDLNQSVPQLPPTLAVEVISEGNTVAEMRQKLKEYFGSGSRLVWMIYPKTRTVEIFEQLQELPTRVLTEADVLDGADVLPGFSIAVSKIFEPLSKQF
jgi:Uma2 family endonuclease